jgi:hypothetical protein
MKIRSGFVSNSSSSSFVLVFPATMTVEKFIEKHSAEIVDALFDRDLDIPGIDWDAIAQMDEWVPSDEEISAALTYSAPFISEILKANEYWLGDRSDVETIILRNINTREYEIARFDTGPDDGSIIVLDRQKLLEKLGAE